MLHFNHVTCYLNQYNEKANIEYIMNYMKVLKHLSDQEMNHHLR